MKIVSTLAMIALLGLVASLRPATAAPDSNGNFGGTNGAAPVSSMSIAGATYDLTLWNGSPYIDLRIDGVTGRFLFDTGANISGVDGGWLRSSRVPYSNGALVTFGATTGVSTTPTASLDRLDLGHGYFSSPSFLVEDFSFFGTPGGQTEAGLLGMDFIGCFDVTLDLAHGKCGLALQSESPLPTPDQVSLPVDLTSTKVPTVNVKVAGVELACRLDTGNAYLDARPFLDVNRAAIATLQRAGIQLVQTGTIAVSGVSGLETLPLYEGASWAGPIALSVGPIDINNLVLVVHDQGTLAIDTPVALAGAPVLQRLGTFRIDCFDSKLWVSTPR